MPPTRNTQGHFTSRVIEETPIPEVEKEDIARMKKDAISVRVATSQATRTYKRLGGTWAGDSPRFTSKLVRGWYKSQRTEGFQHPKTIETVVNCVLGVEHIWQDGRIPAEGGGMAILCNQCASGSVPIGAEGHSVVLVYTMSEVWLFNSQIFPISHQRDVCTGGPIRALSFNGIQLARDIMAYDTRAVSRKWYHVPNNNTNCLESALVTVLALGIYSPWEWANICVDAARERVCSMDRNDGCFRVEDQKIYELRL